MGMNTSDLIDLAQTAAIKAGNEIMNVFNNSEFSVKLKSDSSPLTIADQRAHKVIAEYLKATKIPVLSEEGEVRNFSVRRKWELFWLVDPLDGTKEFINRNDDFTVNIALIRNQAPIGGVVYVPVTKYLYRADNNGSFRGIVQDKDYSLCDVQKLPIVTNRGNFVVVRSRSHMSAETETFIQSLDTNGKPIEVKSKGSSLKICMVAEGNADVYPRLAPTMEWDIAAGHAIANFAGKTVCQYPGNKPIQYNKENLLNPWFVVS